ncbi:serine/threonine-protein kinase [Anabaena sp. UHCC 0399]|uniref:serine/threonine-protein kinase n=1 Tax=Anabaena sp. UHCC 0399 TaxID=3110238 RepID=UPI002B20DFD8|nr:serine/threonine-protein kinase [Anabaena sp. UHCC 0399]MEA5568223.1 serine/threonine-protein kinase [Anabaena sp. UHCC 0399]
MNRFSGNITNLREYSLEQNRLAQMCGSKQLFRDRYEILRILGRGGFGITFLAQDAVLPGNPLCVIKQLCPKVTSTKSWQNACNRFVQEAKTLAKLGSHSQIPMLLDYFEGDGELYLVQEYIQGWTLAREVRRNGTKTEAEVKQFLRELLPVLQYLYQNQVIHRDIKPLNLLRCADDQRIVLIDFGAVKENLVDVGNDSLNSIMNTHFVGTMGFAPPEQFSLRPVYGSDIYALGMTCVYLLTGKGPLEMENHSLTGEICWYKYVNVSDSFAHILNKMLKFSLNERFQKPSDVTRALRVESDMPNLSNCLTTQPIKNALPAKIDPAQEYLSPVAKTAIAIREWKAKLKAQQSQRQLY